MDPLQVASHCGKPHRRLDYAEARVFTGRLRRTRRGAEELPRRFPTGGVAPVDF